METGLRLLMKDGMVRVAFHPRLTAEQYTELLDLVSKSGTRHELTVAVEATAKRWNCQVDIEAVSH
jgi:hypothetical protein